MDSGRQNYLIAGVQCLSGGCVSRRLLLKGDGLTPVLGETLSQQPFENRIAMCPKTMVINRVVVDESGRVALGCAAVLSTMHVFPYVAKTTENKNTWAGLKLLCPENMNGRSA